MGAAAGSTSLPVVLAAVSVGDYHRAEGLVLVGGWLLLAGYGGVLWIIKREAGRVYYLLLRVLEAVLIVQAVTGIVLLATGGHRALLHYGYGGVFPFVVLGVAEVISRDLEKPPLHAVYTIAAFIVFGLMLRAYMTGVSG